MTAPTEPAENFGISRVENPTLGSPTPSVKDTDGKKKKKSAAKKEALTRSPVDETLHMGAARDMGENDPAGDEAVAGAAVGSGAASSASGRAGTSEHGASWLDARRWSEDVVPMVKRVESWLPGTVPVAVGVGAFALVGIVEWPVAVGGAGVYAAYRWLRAGWRGL